MNRFIIPPIKSQGIKTKLIPFISSVVPEVQVGRWIEPFMGTGVVGFNLAASRALMADANPHIVRFYSALQSGEITSGIVRRFLEEEGRTLSSSDGKHYYEMRDRFNREGAPLDFLFLSRACFNGMMRFNSKERFNVPFCRKPERFAPAYITKITNQVALVQDRIMNYQFEFQVATYLDTISQATEGDLIYCDPPYLGRHVDYFNSWTESDELLLAEALKSTKASFILSTWSHNAWRSNPILTEVWGDYPQITQEHFYHVGAREANRQGMTEALVFSSNLEPIQESPKSEQTILDLVF